ncbi:MAG: efflux RND transporter periplasmic adaptor subunit [Polyangiaceae bacterium]|nr:efflux RND transporter periplasmic adaptor subunit [Myxococcales bacterium]MCB9591062.1 efflux RND transporter periplasmic adaptor subunit [Polyangiaceae bacterium]
MMRRFGLVLGLSIAVVGCSKANASKEMPPADPSAAAPVSSLLKAAANEEAPAAASGLTASGSVHAINEAALSAKATGVLVKLNVAEGDRVKKGQVLFQVDSRGAGLAVSSAKVGVSSAKVSLQQAKEDLDRKEGLAKSGATTEAALTASRLNYENAKLSVKRAEVALSDAYRGAGETVVRSPISGLVASKNANEGESVMANGSPVLLVQDITELEIRARLPESALKTVKVDSKAMARFRAIDKSLLVTVKRISPSVDQRTRTIEVICGLANPDEVYKAGMLVELDFGSQGEAAKPAEPVKEETAEAEPAAKKPTGATPAAPKQTGEK